MAKKKVIVDGQYVQICKKWSELTRQQKEWIMTKAWNQFKRIAETQHRPITNIEKKEILHSVYSQIHEKGIWIPFGEIGRVLSSKIARWNGNRKSQYMSTTAIHTLTLKQNKEYHNKESGDQRQKN